MVTNECVLPVTNIVTSAPQQLSNAQERSDVNVKNNSHVEGIVRLSVDSRYRVEDFVGYELTMVPEVECVFVDKDDDNSFVVSTIVNDRDLQVRSRIYDREMAILEAHPGIDFEFNIISRRNRPLAQVMTTRQKPYKRVAA